ncbi:MAG TPA: glycoside hydrolase family 1 protein [Ktedonobacterales bacterium]
MPDSPRDLPFPDGFIWGAATAAHQVEGGNTNNQWYEWEDRGGIATGERSGRAIDWWTRAEDDFDRARDMGLNGMRLSLEWSRIEPEEGRWDEAAIARYRAMLAGLRARGIEPLVTLHHFTNPLWLERKGAFQTAAVVPLFERYARHCAEVFGDLCDFWCTVNEPNVYASMGYLLGAFPPGRKGDFTSMLRVHAHMLRAHAAAYRAIHSVQPHARVGIAHHIRIFDAARRSHPLDQLVAWIQDLGFNALVLDALHKGHGTGIVRLFARHLSSVRGTYDFLGLNYYSRDMVTFDLRYPAELFARRFTFPGAERMDGGASEVQGDTYGELYPDGMRRALLRMARYGRPLYVTENGFPDTDDDQRPSGLVRTLVAVYQAIQRKAPVKGYYHWSLVDNFEWAEGWSLRFGLIAVDPATQERAPRTSAGIYSRISHANAVPADLIAQYVPGEKTPA